MLLHVIFVIAIAALILWAITQFPLDATLVKLIRVIVIVAVCLWLLGMLLGGGFGDFAAFGTAHPCRP